MFEKTKLRNIPIESCVTLQRNPQYLTPAQMDSLKASIQRDGFLVPILVRPLPGGKYEIISGNHRFMAAQELGMKSIPAIVANLSDKQKSRLIINMNTIHGEPTVEQLAPFLAELDDLTLSEIHLEDDMFAEVADFDGVLANRLSELQAPESLDRQSTPTLITCVCKRCGARHAKGKRNQK